MSKSLALRFPKDPKRALGAGLQPMTGAVFRTCLPAAVLIMHQGRPALIERGQRHLSAATPDIVDQASCDRANRICGITPAQVEAMRIGVEWGWTVPGANPANHVQTLHSTAR